MQNQVSARNGQKSARDRRIAEVVRVLCSKDDSTLFVVTNLKAGSNRDLEQALITMTVPDGSKTVKWSIQLSGPGIGPDFSSYLDGIVGDEVFLDSEDIQILLGIVTRFNRFFSANLFLAIPDEWRNEPRKEVNHA